MSEIPPRPWKTVDHKSPMLGPMTKIIDADEQTIVPNLKNEAHRKETLEHIVKCVNAYDELVELAEAVYFAEGDDYIDRPVPGFAAAVTISQILKDKAEAALRKTRGDDD